jgi:NADPH:quinone reductase-like Zn-dependent oxidoreductase
MPRAKTVDIWDSFNRDPETYKKNLKSLFQLLKWNKIKPHVARRISLPEVASAQTKMENGDIRGIVVCLPWKRVGQSDVSRDSRDEVRE